MHVEIVLAYNRANEQELASGILFTFSQCFPQFFCTQRIFKVAKKSHSNILFREKGTAATEHTQFNAACHHIKNEIELSVGRPFRYEKVLLWSHEQAANTI